MYHESKASIPTDSVKFIKKPLNKVHKTTDDVAPAT